MTTGVARGWRDLLRRGDRRQQFVKDPDTGKRQARPNPPSEWITSDVPALRIIDDEFWNAVETRQRTMRHAGRAVQVGEIHKHRRPKYLFSG